MGSSRISPLVDCTTIPGGSVLSRPGIVLNSSRYSQEKRIFIPMSQPRRVEQNGSAFDGFGLAVFIDVVGRKADTGYRFGD